ncbi:hypothetical protein V5799_006790, partial [Amblyomma americanum]
WSNLPQQVITCHVVALWCDGGVWRGFCMVSACIGVLNDACKMMTWSGKAVPRAAKELVHSLASRSHLHVTDQPLPAALSGE